MHVLNRTLTQVALHKEAHGIGFARLKVNTVLADTRVLNDPSNKGLSHATNFAEQIFFK